MGDAAGEVQDLDVEIVGLAIEGVEEDLFGFEDGDVEACGAAALVITTSDGREVLADGFEIASLGVGVQVDAIAAGADSFGVEEFEPDLVLLV